MEVHLVSDLHLELYTPDMAKELVELLLGTEYPEATLLVPGDLCCLGTPEQIEVYRAFLTHCKARYKHVLFTSGNHELYNLRDTETIDHVLRGADALLTDLAVSTGTVYLQKGVAVIDGTRFLGCTLWSDVTEQAYHGINDSVKVFRSVDEYRSLHQDHLVWLTQALRETPSVTPQVGEDTPGHWTRTVVMTHHLPSPSLIAPQYRGSAINPAFATDLDHLMQSPASSLPLWVCGHTHAHATARVSDTQLVVNPLGYAWEIEDPKVYKCSI
jgi:3',5'-cyclic AMP phosphodiesterase CpdA